MILTYLITNTPTPCWVGNKTESRHRVDEASGGFWHIYLTNYLSATCGASKVTPATYAQWASDLTETDHVRRQR